MKELPQPELSLTKIVFEKHRMDEFKTAVCLINTPNGTWRSDFPIHVQIILQMEDAELREMIFEQTKLHYVNREIHPDCGEVDEY